MAQKRVAGAAESPPGYDIIILGNYDFHDREGDEEEKHLYLADMRL